MDGWKSNVWVAMTISTCRVGTRQLSFVSMNQPSCWMVPKPEVGHKRACGTSIAISHKPTYGPRRAPHLGPECKRLFSTVDATIACKRGSWQQSANLSGSTKLEN